MSVDDGGAWSHGHPTDISNVLKHSADLLGPAKSDAALHFKRQRAVSYPLVEMALTFWLQQETGEEFSGMIQKMQDQVENLQQKSLKQQTLDNIFVVVPRQ